MSVNTETAPAQGQTAVLEKESVYASLFDKINLTPASRLGDINDFLDDAALSDAPAGERLTAAMQVFMDCIRQSGKTVEKLDKTLIDHHIADPDRPYIAYALHDSEHPDHVTSDNHTRNVWRTPANNKLRMEDKRQEEHIKLATEYGKTQLNMGHLVNGQREKRGAGFELRTDEHGAVRAAKGLFLTADAQAKAQGPVMEMAPAINQINQANSQMQALNSAAEAAGALVCDINTQISFVTDKIKDLQSSVLLGSAPQGVALTSGEHLQLSSTRNTMVNAGQHLDIGAMKNLSVTVEKALGMFVHKEGAKLVANQGDIEIQAQHNTMGLFSEKQLTVTSSEDEIIISTPETLTLNGGGSYLRLSKNGIEHGSSGEFIMKTSDYLVPGLGADLPNETPNFSLTDITQENKISSKSFND